MSAVRPLYCCVVIYVCLEHLANMGSDPTQISFAHMTNHLFQYEFVFMKTSSLKLG
jgi:hypothetical protein